MPSWNVHIAHTERILAEKDLCAPAIRNTDAFLLGNLVPDIYVGYMVPDVSHKIPYKDTHYADPTFIPAPDASRFYRSYVQGRDATDLELGVWCHLLCDHYYNWRTTEYINHIGVAPGEQTRIRKQADFALYGRTLDISLVPRLTPEVLRQALAFEQYDLLEDDLRKTVVSAAEIVHTNQQQHMAHAPTYDLLTNEFFRSTAQEVNEVLRTALDLYGRGEDASHLGDSASLLPIEDCDA